MTTLLTSLLEPSKLTQMAFTPKTPPLEFDDWFNQNYGDMVEVGETECLVCGGSGYNHSATLSGDMEACRDCDGTCRQTIYRLDGRNGIDRQLYKFFSFGRSMAAILLPHGIVAREVRHELRPAVFLATTDLRVAMNILQEAGYKLEVNSTQIRPLLIDITN